MKIDSDDFHLAKGEVNYPFILFSVIDVLGVSAWGFLLAARGEPLTITPVPEGPLAVTGNLEICAGTGRTVDRMTAARLCR
jgi:hypothetical protein